MLLHKPLLEQSMDEVVRKAHFCGMLQEANFRLAKNSRGLRDRVDDLQRYNAGLLERVQFLEQALARNNRTLEELIGGASALDLMNRLEAKLAEFEQARPVLAFESYTVLNIAKRVLKREGILQ